MELVDKVQGVEFFVTLLSLQFGGRGAIAKLFGLITWFIVDHVVTASPPPGGKSLK
jgi:hypothetical protein